MTIQSKMDCKHQVWGKVTKGIAHEFLKYQCAFCGEERFDENDPEVMGVIPKTPDYKKTEDIAKNVLHCTCYDCMKKAANLEKHLTHPFYKEVDEFVWEIRDQQIEKGAEKYPEPFNPDSWTNDELATHAMQEMRDGQVYITGMRHRMRKQAEEIKYLKQRLEMVTELNSKMSKAVDYWMGQAFKK